MNLLNKESNTFKLKHSKIKIIYLMTACKKSGPTQQTLNIIKNLDFNTFEPILMTIRKEKVGNSRLSEFLPYVSAHYHVKTNKISILTGFDFHLKKILQKLNPDIIHTIGVFPDYAISKMKKYKQIHTLRNYMYDDYIERYGNIIGSVLAKLQLSAIKASDKTITCSESLSKIYKRKLGMNFDFICNGVDVDKYTAVTSEGKHSLREKLKLPINAFIFVYACRFSGRKNVSFLLENYIKEFDTNEFNVYLLLLGDGPNLPYLKQKYGKFKNIDFRGNVSNVNEYLKACDVYVSTSKSEGLPNSVLEAMATGLPVILSDIEQHREIYDVNHGIGYLYEQGNGRDLTQKMKLIYNHTENFGQVAYDVAHTAFNAKNMSICYQEIYKKLADVYF